MKVAVYTGASMIRKTRVVGSYGKQIAGNTGTWRIGVVCGDRSVRFVNGKADDAFAAKTWALLRGLEFAVECHPEATEVEIFTDAQSVGQVSANIQANDYLRELGIMAAARGVKVRVSFVAGKGNPAARISRTEEDPGRRVGPADPFSGIFEPGALERARQAEAATVDVQGRLTADEKGRWVASWGAGGRKARRTARGAVVADVCSRTGACEEIVRRALGAATAMEGYKALDKGGLPCAGLSI